jgi:hypothetical protein
MAEDILHQETIIFDPSSWIGRNKIYKDVPLHVCNALVNLRKVPESITSTYPAPALPIADFIDLKLPAQSADIITSKISYCFIFEVYWKGQ